MSLTLKRNYPLLILLVVVILSLTLGLGGTRIVAYTTAGSPIISAKGVVNYTNVTHLFDHNQVHAIQISMSDTDYQSMLTTYQQTGVKDFFHANVTVDGVLLKNVGIRLKGNASLRQALGGGAGGGGNPRGGVPPNPPGGGNFQAPPGQGGPGGRNAQIPLLIKFDQFVSNQRYQGYDRFAIRSAGISYDASMLQEPVTNSVLRLLQQPATQTAYAGVSLNGKAEQLFSISEVIEEDYLAKFFANKQGILYKAEFQANLSYLGEDPSAYARSFSQETRENEADLAPLIRFLKFVSEADDATFAAELLKRLDVDSFATYLAVNSLLVNTDSMAGLGNNFYLYYDDAGERFSVLMWDANESLGKLGAGGGPGGRGGPGAGSGSAASADIYPQTSGQGFGGRGGGGRANPLLTRFMANASFKTLYEQKVKLVYQRAFLSGAMAGQVAQFTSVVRAANSRRNFVDATAYDKAVASVQDFITQRGQYLASTPLLNAVTADSP